MIIGAVAATDRAAADLVTRVAAWLPGTRVESSVSRGVVIACLNGPDLVPSVFAQDHAYIGGALDPPGGPELRGDFAMVARRGNVLSLTRGRFAGRPLFWTRIGEATVACSRLLPLAALRRGRIELNLDHVLALFDGALWFWDRPLPFAGFECVAANTRVDCDASGKTEVASGLLDLGPELAMTDADLAALVHDELAAAVARQAAGARKVAVFCGGGVDSSNLLAAAVSNAKAAAGPSALAVAFDFGGPGDDRPYLADLCAHLRIDPLRVAPAEGASFAGLERIVDGCAHAIAPQSFVIAAAVRARAAGADVALFGESSEVLFDTDASLFTQFLRDSTLRALGCALRFVPMQGTRHQAIWHMVAAPGARGLLPSAVVRARHLRMAAAQNDREFSWAGPRLLGHFHNRRYRPPKGRQSQRERVRGLASSPALMSSGETLSRWETVTGLTMRRPYLDDGFVRLLGRVPTAAMFAGARDRGLLRESMGGRVPDEVRYRTRKARMFEAHAELFRALGGAASVSPWLDMREMTRLGLVNPTAYKRAFQKFASDPGADPTHWGTLWAAIAGEQYVRWFRDFNDGTGVER